MASRRDAATQELCPDNGMEIAITQKRKSGVDSALFPSSRSPKRSLVV